MLLIVVFFTTPVHALQTVPYKMNFQGRLTDASGNAMPNGTYNMKFRIYDALTAGTQQWTETRANSAATGVTVTNGLFSVQLGDVTSLPASIFTNQNLYFEIELPTPATATCSTGSCESYTEGPMGPRNKLGTSAYAFNSDTLDGLDSTAFAASSGSASYIQNQSASQQAASSYWISGTARADTAVVTPIIKAAADSATAIRIQNAAGSSTLLTADTSSMQIIIGSTTNGVAFSANGVTYVGTGRPSNQVTLAAEYPGATFTGDNSNNNGSLSSDFCSGSSRMAINPMVNGTPSTNPCSATQTYNYYQWTTSQATAQDYDIYVRYQIPSDYDTGSMTNLSILGWGTTTANEQVTVALFSDASTTTPCSTTTNAVTSNATWVQVTTASPLGSCTIVAGDVVTFRVHLQAGQGNYARSGPVSFAYKKKF
jgi:hypothetical protein